MVPEKLQASSTSSLIGSGTWQIFTEKVGVWGQADFIKNELVDHLNTTKDTTDYLWYTTRSVLLALLLTILFMILAA